LPPSFIADSVRLQITSQNNPRRHRIFPAAVFPRLTGRQWNKPAARVLFL
jgi:hypothetical protein